MSDKLYTTKEIMEITGLSRPTVDSRIRKLKITKVTVYNSSGSGRPCMCLTHVDMIRVKDYSRSSKYDGYKTIDELVDQFDIPPELLLRYARESGARPACVELRGNNKQRFSKTQIQKIKNCIRSKSIDKHLVFDSESDVISNRDMGLYMMVQDYSMIGSFQTMRV